jgi:carbohydrate kinase (thermoresistant glucokinase family)
VSTARPIGGSSAQRSALDAAAPLAVVMGVSGCGKTTLACALAARLSWAFIEGDDCHPPANRQRMASGLALDDQMREPWVAEVCRRVLACQGPLVLAFSGLRQAHRKRLCGLRENVLFLHLQVPTAMLEQRLRQRAGHFMPPSLLGSQLAALEPVDGETPVVTLGGEADLDTLLGQAALSLSRWPAAQRWVP